MEEKVCFALCLGHAIDSGPTVTQSIMVMRTHRGEINEKQEAKGLQGKNQGPDYVF